MRLADLLSIALCLLGVLGLSACSTPSAPDSLPSVQARVLSPGPNYYGERPVERVYAYIFLDMRPQHIHPEFRSSLDRELKLAFQASGVAFETRWFMDSVEGQRLQADMKSRTSYNSTSVPVGETINENAEADMAFAPSHRLIVFPHETYKAGRGAVIDVKWDVLDSRTHFYEWSVYTRTPALAGDMKSTDAIEAGRALAQVIAKELKARQLLR